METERLNSGVRIFEDKFSSRAEGTLTGATAQAKLYRCESGQQICDSRYGGHNRKDMCANCGKKQSHGDGNRRKALAVL